MTIPTTCCKEGCSEKPTRALRMKVWARGDTRPRTDEIAFKLVVGLVCCEAHAEAMVAECKPVDETKAQIEVAVLRSGHQPPDWSTLVLEAAPIDEVVPVLESAKAAANKGKIITQGPLH